MQCFWSVLVQREKNRILRRISNYFNFPTTEIWEEKDDMIWRDSCRALSDFCLVQFINGKSQGGSGKGTGREKGRKYPTMPIDRPT